MGKIKKLLENELIGGSQSTEVYPVTSTKAVFDSSNESVDSYLQHINKTYSYVGIAVPSTVPDNSGKNRYYIATKSGIYENFNNIEVANGEVAILKYNKSEWIKDSLDISKESNSTSLPYTENSIVNKIIEGVYVFGNEDEIAEIKKLNLEFTTIYNTDEPFSTISTVDGNQVIFSSGKTATPGLQEFITTNPSYSSIKIYILYNVQNIHLLTGTIYGIGFYNFLFDSKDANVITYLQNNYRYIEFGESNTTELFQQNSIINLRLDKHNSNSKYGIKVLEIITSTGNGRITFTITKDGSTTSYNADVPSSEFSYEERVINLPDGTVVYIQIDWDIVKNSPYDVITNGRGKDVGVVFNRNAFIPTNSITKSELDNYIGDFEDKINTTIDNLDSFKAEIKSEQANNNQIVQSYASTLEDLQRAVEDINTEEITNQYQLVMSNYEQLSKVVDDNKSDSESSIADISKSLSENVKVLTDLINSKTLEISDNSININMLSESLQDLIKAVGGGTITNTPDEETLTQKGGLISIKDIEKDSTRYLGIKRISSLPSKFSPNTKYLVTKNIQSDSPITLPLGSSFYPSGGMVDAEYISQATCFVTASDLGMIPNNAGSASINHEIFSKAIKNKYSIYLDSIYYIDNSLGAIPVDYPLHLTGGGIIINNNSALLSFNEGASIVMSNVQVKCTEEGAKRAYLISAESKVGFLIDDIIIRDCSINDVILVNISFSDIDATISDLGVNNLILTGCNIRLRNTALSILDAVFHKTCQISNNHISELEGTSIYFGVSDEGTFTGKNCLLSVPIVITDNIFLGRVCSINYYCGAALVEAKECIFSNNYIEGIINTSNGDIATCYDAYLSCNKVYYTNNVCINIMGARYDSSTGRKPLTEYGKSKQNPDPSVKGIRVLKNNVWKTDCDYLKSLGLSEDDFSSTIFGYTSDMEVIWENNYVELIGGTLSFRTSSIGVWDKLIVDNNTFITDKIENQVIMARAVTDSSVIITNNKFYSKEPINFITAIDGYFDKYYVKNNYIENGITEYPGILNATIGKLYFDNDAIFTKGGSNIIKCADNLDVHYKFTDDTSKAFSAVFKSSALGKLSLDTHHLGKSSKANHIYLSLDGDSNFNVKIIITYTIGNKTYMYSCEGHKLSESYIVDFDGNARKLGDSYSPSFLAVTKDKVKVTFNKLGFFIESADDDFIPDLDTIINIRFILY